MFDRALPLLLVPLALLATAAIAGLLAVELDHPRGAELELHVFRCPAGHLLACWLASQTGRRVAFARVGFC